jgi:ribonuclease HI
MRNTPHYLLFSRADRAQQGGWSFVLQSVDGAEKLEASDSEPQVRGERLELLAVVLGLEALDQPSRVTIVTPSRYVQRGINAGLEEWRSQDWTWERHGEMVEVKNSDLWQRLDRALAFHQVECRCWRFDAAHEDTAHRHGAAAIARPRRRPMQPSASKGQAHSWAGRIWRLWMRLRHPAQQHDAGWNLRAA